MRRLPTQHGTVVLGQTCEAPLALVYAAFADPLELAKLGVAGDEAVVILDEADIRVGGADRYRMWERIGPRMSGWTTYHDIVPHRRIVATEACSDGDRRLSVALTTLEFTVVGNATQLKLTAQVATLDDRMEACARYEILMGNLDRHLGLPTRPPRRPVLARR